MKFLKVAGAVAALSFAALASAAHADIYILNVSQAQSAMPGPYGQVEVTQTGAGLGGVGQLTFTVSLFNDLQFVDTGAHHTFTFSLDNIGSVTVNAPTGFIKGGTPSANNVPNAPYGDFDFFIGCNGTACGNGSSSPLNGPITFTVDGTGLSLANLGAATDGNLFAADTYSKTTGATGTIAGGVPGGVPEPATWAMLIAGFGMVGAGLRLRRRPEFTPA